MMENFKKIQWYIVIPTVSIFLVLWIISHIIYDSGYRSGKYDCKISKIHDACDNYEYTIKEIQDCHEKLNNIYN